MVQLLDRLAHREATNTTTTRPIPQRAPARHPRGRHALHREPSAPRVEPGLAVCGRCGHSERNHELGTAACARALCDCASFG